MTSQPDRRVLSIPDAPFNGETPLDAKDPAAVFPPIDSIKPPTVPMVFSADETADIGRDMASPVSDDYNAESSVFTGTVAWVQIDLGSHAEDADHLISPEERLRVALARQ